MKGLVPNCKLQQDLARVVAARVAANSAARELARQALSTRQARERAMALEAAAKAGDPTVAAQVNRLVCAHAVGAAGERLAGTARPMGRQRRRAARGQRGARPGCRR